ncbi:transposase, partial [bacterium]|nr:transposase [bacterium]
MIVHIILRYSRLRDVQCYQNDPLVLQFLGMGSIPSASTVSRMLFNMDAPSVDKLVELIQGLVIERLRLLNLKRITIDFDGSVLTTNGHAEETAVGFNPKKKGQRSYYPLFATVAQLDQVLSVLHRSGNVHDSHNAKDFITRVVELVRKALPNAVIEVRADSAFYSEELLFNLERLQAQCTVSVSFESYANLKKVVESRKRWRRVDKEFSGFDRNWKADSWPKERRFIFVKKKVKKQQKGPIQLDLFVRHEERHEFKAIVTNKNKSIKSIVLFHHGRGSQEKIFG